MLRFPSEKWKTSTRNLFSTNLDYHVKKPSMGDVANTLFWMKIFGIKSSQRRLASTMMDKIFGIFFAVDHYNENHKSFQTPLQGIKPIDFSFSFSYWPWAFGSKDRLGRKRAKWGKYEASKIAEYPYQRIFFYHQSWPNYETFCQTRFFNVCCFETKIPIYSVHDFLENQEKPIFGKKTGPKQYFSISIFIRRLSLPSFGPKTVAPFQI